MAYLWRNRSLSKTSEQLNSIVGILIFNLVLGGIQDTSIDNIGEHSPPLRAFYAMCSLSEAEVPITERCRTSGEGVSRSSGDASQ